MIDCGVLAHFAAAGLPVLPPFGRTRCAAYESLAI